MWEGYPSTVPISFIIRKLQSKVLLAIREQYKTHKIENRLNCRQSKDIWPTGGGYLGVRAGR